MVEADGSTEHWRPLHSKCSAILMFEKSVQIILLNFRGKPTLFIPLKEMTDVKAASLLNGCGQNAEILSRQKKALEDKKRKTLANAKIFEELERQADEALEKDMVRLSNRLLVQAKGLGPLITRPSTFPVTFSCKAFCFQFQK